MDFSLNMGTMTKGIEDYIKQHGTLGEEKTNINYAVSLLKQGGWTGEASESFLKAHEERMALYEEVEEDVQTMINILKDEKERALKLKQRSDGFINCIRRSGDIMPATEEDSGIVALDYGGQMPINFHVNNCIDEDYTNLKYDFKEINELIRMLEYTSFHLDTDTAITSVNKQTESLTDFDKSFNMYCTEVKDLESYICSQFARISGVSQGTFKSSHIIAPNGDINKDQLKYFILKNKDGLTIDRKEKLDYIEKVLGKDKYNRLKEILAKPTAELTESDKQMLSKLNNISNLENIELPDDCDDNIMPTIATPTADGVAVKLATTEASDKARDDGAGAVYDDYTMEDIAMQFMPGGIFKEGASLAADVLVNGLKTEARDIVKKEITKEIESNIVKDGFEEVGKPSLEEAEAINRILPNGESIIDITSLPGANGMDVPRRLTPNEMRLLTEENGVEFALVYQRGKGISGSGGQYKLFSGTINRVQVPIDEDLILVYHTHPAGSAFASDGDRKVLTRLMEAGSPQRSSQIIPIGSDEIARFDIEGTPSKWPR